MSHGLLGLLLTLTLTPAGADEGMRCQDLTLTRIRVVEECPSASDFCFVEIRPKGRRSFTVPFRPKTDDPTVEAGYSHGCGAFSFNKPGAIPEGCEIWITYGPTDGRTSCTCTDTTCRTNDLNSHGADDSPQ